MASTKGTIIWMVMIIMESFSMKELFLNELARFSDASCGFDVGAQPGNIDRFGDRVVRGKIGKLRGAHDLHLGRFPWAKQRLLNLSFSKTFNSST
jgi:hypothetical protein